MKEIDVSKFEREIAAEYMRLYGKELEGNELSIRIMNIAATAAAIAIKLREQELNK